MAERRRLDPRSLDRLEDALALLGPDTDLDALLSDPALDEGPSGTEASSGARASAGELDTPAIREALVEAQAVLRLASEAWPTVEPSEDVVMAILAEAETAARAPAAVEPSPRAAGQRGVWRWLLPSLALAGSAALVLLLVQPDESRVSGRTSAEQVASAEAKQLAGGGAASRERRNAAGDGPLPAEEAAAPDPPAPAIPSAAAAGADAESAGVVGGLVGQTQGVTTGRASKDEGAAAPGGKGGGGASNAAMPKPAPSKKQADGFAVADEAESAVESEKSKDGTWSRLDTAHRKRRKGDCSGAKRDYEAVLASKPDPVARAQALAGLGLCLESDGDQGRAADRFDEAREAYAGADAWLEGERATAPTPSEAKSRKSSKSASSKAGSSQDGKADGLP